MPPKITAPPRSNIHNVCHQSLRWQGLGVRARLAGLFLLMLLPVFPTMGLCEVNAASGHTIGASSGERGETTRNEEGFPVPRKGPLISELREDLDPEIPGAETIIRRYEDGGGNVVQEFFMNGVLYQIEVIPVGGSPYYLVDVTGNGLFEERHQGHKPRLLVPQWVLFRF